MLEAARLAVAETAPKKAAAVKVPSVPTGNLPSSSGNGVDAASASESLLVNSNPSQVNNGSSSQSSDGPRGSSMASGETLTRRWSGLSDEHATTRHVLQSALDAMQRSGEPIPEATESCSTADLSISLEDVPSSSTVAPGADDDGHGPAPLWAQSLLGVCGARVGWAIDVCVCVCVCVKKRHNEHSLDVATHTACGKTLPQVAPCTSLSAPL